MKKKNFLLFAAISFTAFFTSGCNNAKPEKEETATESTATAVTNPNFSIAPIEYSELTEKALTTFAKFDFDGWAAMLSDTVVYAFPDGDVGTRTRLIGKAAVLAWWKTWKEKSGVQSVEMTEFNHFPLNVTAQPKGGALMGNYDFVYFSDKLVFNGKPVSLRMNYAIHFNADKKIDRYITYYDRSVLMKATGRNMLEEIKVKK
jgi:hypothetical protein